MMRSFLFFLSLFTLAAVVVPVAHALAAQKPLSSWLPLPHVERREVLGVGASALSAGLVVGQEAHASSSGRSVGVIGSSVAIPVWPTWGGGRVVPVSLGGPLQDPFLLLAHHKHWFDPKDFLRGPFKAVGKALGLPYVDVEGFSMHPHRGLDILTYVLDGSDGFRHRDSLGGSRTYRGGSAQWMRTGAGVLHEEFWETRDDRRTNIELYQLWMNLPASQKFDKPAVEYVGKSTENPWVEETLPSGVWIRNVGTTLTSALEKVGDDNQDGVNARPPVEILHVTMEPGATWEAPAPRDHSAVLYVREGTATLSGSQTAKALQMATFFDDGDSITIQNVASREKLDLLLLTGTPLREPIALGGPIVMNTEEELNDAYRQMQDGTFLNRNVALKQQADTMRRSGRVA